MLHVMAFVYACYSQGSFVCYLVYFTRAFGSLKEPLRKKDLSCDVL